jgi:hypothetical protein
LTERYSEVNEKKKMDPVNPDELKGTHAQRKDKDIDNDGDVDKSDEYLHNRRKAIKTAMKKEETELDEADVYSIKNTKTGQIYHNSKYPIDKNTQVYKKIKSAGGDHKHAAIHKNGKLVQEEVEDLDEIFGSSKFAKGLRKKMGDASNKKMADFYRKGHEENHNKHLSLAMSGSRTSDHNGHEGSYVQHRNAAEEHKGTPAGKHHAAAAASHDAAADHLDKYKKSGDVKHLNTAVKHSEAAVEHSKKADKAGGTNTDSHLVHSDTKSVMFHHKGMKEDFANNAYKLAKEEVEKIDELSKKTLGSYVKKAAGDAVTKAYKAGDVRDKDSSKNYMKALGRQIGISKATSKLAKEEVELDEAAPKIKPDFVKTQREKDRAHDAAMGRTATGRKKTMTSTQKSMASMRKENEVQVEEATIQRATHKGYQDPMGVGLSPSAKVELGRTTDAPSDAFDANKVIAKTFKDMRASLKNKKMRKGDQDTGDKAPVKNDGK